MLEGKKKKKQKLSEGQTEEWRLFSATLSPAFSSPLTATPVADEHSNSQFPVRVEEVRKYFHANKSGCLHVFKNFFAV